MFVAILGRKLNQRAELDTLLDIEGARAQLAPGDQGLAQFFDAARLTAGQVGGLQAQGVVLVLGDVLFVGGCFVGAEGGEAGLFEVGLQMAEYVLQQQILVHGVLSGSS